MYNNEKYWKGIHTDFDGLKAVGRVGLSSCYNRFKYKSEQYSFEKSITTVLLAAWRKKGKLRILDAGTGNGYWTNVLKKICNKHTIEAEFTAIDISKVALSKINTLFPDVLTYELDITKENYFFKSNSFDVVICNYVLHHITIRKDFEYAINNLCGVLHKQGHLIIMDAILTRSFSPYYNMDESAYEGSGLSRSLSYINKLCGHLNVHQIHCSEPISFLLNNCLEAGSRSSYKVKLFVWRILEKLYKHEWISRVIIWPVYFLDWTLKTIGYGFSSKLVLYQLK